VDDFGSKLELLAVLAPILIGSLVLHELAHAWVATWLGDKTPRQQGRLTLNPIKHLDPFGAGMFIFTFMFTPFAFGWAKPVIVDRRNLKHDQRDMAIVAAAGPLVNFVIAFAVYAVAVHGVDISEWSPYWQTVMIQVIRINVVLGIFNLLPIPPLDGSRIIGAFMPRRMYEDWSKLDQYAMLFILAIFLVFRAPFTALLSDLTDRVFTAFAWLVGLG
jgi:Zn-dependent protease